ncbi:TRAP transporter small permease subunit [Roseospira marina]|uniref:TRAP transporter small permease protein n=1 Tax=Roseospira marina TaxID=140057 RepID=A0A5M6IAL5_9PROT|nr:TRAP transporter small permease subunit [Roseospira marina]KAA5605311.1 TRAP transporter small permease subunit [Roseospira marina]MBB4314779.1 TRAP-type C4-dicarboxylate transport system permease small subunit [Roseospira marina]MBB5087768.1 TRAP-type C4-dicarboxylate transport system permease small subunit [Roseospira marina]
MSLLRTALWWAWRGIDVAMAASMVVMIVIVFVNVVLRYGFSSGILATAEASRFLFVWIIMLGAVVCLRDEAHLDLRMIERTLPRVPRALLRMVVWAVVILTSGMLFLGAFRQTIDNWGNISPLSGIPVGAMYLAGAVAGALMAVIGVLRVLIVGWTLLSGDEEVAP